MVIVSEQLVEEINGIIVSKVLVLRCDEFFPLLAWEAERKQIQRNVSPTRRRAQTRKKGREKKKKKRTAD